MFSEAVTDFADGDVTLGGTAGATTAAVTGSGSTYNVAVSGMTQSGTVTASIPAGVAQNSSGNPNTASISSGSVTYNKPADPTKIDELLDFNDNSVPISWTMVRVNNTGNAGVRNGRLETNPTDSYGYLSRPISLGSDITRLSITYLANIDAALWGMGASTRLVLDDGSGVYTHAGKTGNRENTISINLGIEDGNNVPIKIAPTYGVYRFVAEYFSGGVRFRAEDPATGAMLFDESRTVADFTVQRIRELRLFVFTTTDVSCWMDDVQISTQAVPKATPVLTWATPVAITYGTALSSTQLNASANVSGTFDYSPASGTVLGADTQSLSVTFTPTDSTNYSTTTKSVNLTVNKAPLTVTAENKSRIYGAANPDFTWAASGFVNGDTHTVLSGTPDLNTSATARSSVGPYPIAITAGTLAAPNYSTNLVPGTLNITKAGLRTIADNKVKKEGSLNPTLTITYANFSNGDTVADLDTLPTISTTAGTNSPPAAYSINLSGGADNNYDFAFQTGTLTVTPKTSQFITFDAPAGQSYGAGPLALSASASSGLPVTFSLVSGPATLSGSTLTLTGAGDVTVRASQAGNADYAVAPNVDRMFTVGRAALTVTAEAKSRTYGANNPVFTAAISGFVNGETTVVVTGSPSFANVATNVSNAGPYAITPTIGTLAATNYSFTTFNPGTLTVTKAPLTVTADNKSKMQGSANPTLTVNYSGFVNGDTAGSLTMQPTATTTAVLSSPLGNYPITPAGGVSTNYSFTYLPGTLSVNQPGAPAFTTQPVSQSITVGNSATFTAAASGSPSYQWQKNNVNISGATNSSFTVSNAAAASAGNYAVIATNGSGSVTSNIAILTVNKIKGTVTLGGLWTTYDGLPHAATVVGTTPIGLTVDVTYDGSATAPTIAGSYAVVATINDPTYAGTSSVTLNISKANPVITWATPAPITSPMALGATQLNATANVAGTFVYSPASGTVLPVGNHTLTATFNPTDQTNYSFVGVAQTTLTVLPGTGGVIPIGFDVKGYLTRYPEVAAVYGTDWYGAWVYYRDHGIYQGQVYDELLRVEEYLALYPELVAIFGNDLGGALMHWLTQGSIEGKLGRIPLEFKAQGYFDRNPDVAAAVGNNTILAWGHYWLYGIYEGRAYDDELRVFEYLAINADLTAAFVDDWRTAALHWMRYGRTEGRLGRIPLIFSAPEYLRRNPDVGPVWGTDPTTDFLHFWLYGINEGRTFDDLFRVDDYLALNPDLAAVFGTDRRGAFKHWVRYGQVEGRPGRNP